MSSTSEVSNAAIWVIDPLCDAPPIIKCYALSHKEGERVFVVVNGMICTLSPAKGRSLAHSEEEATAHAILACKKALDYLVEKERGLREALKNPLANAIHFSR